MPLPPDEGGPGAALAAALAAEEEKLLACVHCGFCLSSCPTYTRLGDEADSPRGRLHLMRAVVEGRLQPDAPAFVLHIDRCLGCRACETVCPSGVEYGALLERARAASAAAAGNSLVARALLAVFGSRLLTRIAMAAGRAARATGLPRALARRLPPHLARARLGFAMLASTAPPPLPVREGDGETDRVRDRSGDPHGSVPRTPPAPGDPHPRTGGAGPEGTHRPTVALLTGCVQEGLYGRVNRATEYVLRANGCTVVAVPGQVCCGAIHAHTGDLASAEAMARANIEAFEGAGAERVVANAAGCGALLKEYPQLLAGDPAFASRARAFARRVRDLSELLLELGPAPGAPLPLRVTYDAPCHLHHAQRITSAPLDVLVAAIPELELVPLPGADECCGGAGVHGLLHPELGGRILADKVRAIRSTDAEAVLTPNPGCMMQIGAGLLLEGVETPVLHPVELLAESYRRRERGR